MSDNSNSTTTTINSAVKRRRGTTRKQPGDQQAAATDAKMPSRLDQLQDLLTRENGASIAEMVEATGWQQHSVRGAMAGALKKRGLIITSDEAEGVRRYHAERPA